MIRLARDFMLLVCDVDHDVRFYESDAHKSELIPTRQGFDFGELWLTFSLTQWMGPDTEVIHSER